MGIFTKLIDVAGGNIFEGIGSLAKDIRQAITGEISPDKKAEIDMKLATLEDQASKAQMAINLAEAKSGNWFVAGWRPFVGWTCGLGFFYAAVARPVAIWILKLYQINSDLPPIDTKTLMTLLFALLGFGGYRMIEKAKDIQDRH